jgi:hypothetical protein
MNEMRKRRRWEEGEKRRGDWKIKEGKREWEERKEEDRREEKKRRIELGWEGKRRGMN